VCVRARACLLLNSRYPLHVTSDTVTLMSLCRKSYWHFPYYG